MLSQIIMHPKLEKKKKRDVVTLGRNPRSRSILVLKRENVGVINNKISLTEKRIIKH